jgi:hypothetical protein
MSPKECSRRKRERWGGIIRMRTLSVEMPKLREFVYSRVGTFPEKNPALHIHSVNSLEI